MVSITSSTNTGRSAVSVRLPDWHVPARTWAGLSTSRATLGEASVYPDL